VVLRVARESAARSRLEKGPSGPYPRSKQRAEGCGCDLVNNVTAKPQVPTLRALTSLSPPEAS